MYGIWIMLVFIGPTRTASAAHLRHKTRGRLCPWTHSSYGTTGILKTGINRTSTSPARHLNQINIHLSRRGSFINI